MPLTTKHGRNSLVNYSHGSVIYTRFPHRLLRVARREAFFCRRPRSRIRKSPPRRVFPLPLFLRLDFPPVILPFTAAVSAATAAAGPDVLGAAVLGAAAVLGDAVLAAAVLGAAVLGAAVLGVVV